MSDDDIDALLGTRIPGGSSARDWFLPHDTERGLANVRDVVRLMVGAHLARRADSLKADTSPRADRYIATKLDLQGYESSLWHDVNAEALPAILSSEELAAILAAEDPGLRALGARLKKQWDESRTAHMRDAVILAHRQHHVDGNVEIDGAALVSEGDSNGAYALGWFWVDFAGTPLDKERGEEEHTSGDARASPPCAPGG